MKYKILVGLLFPFMISSCFEQDEIRLRRDEDGVITSKPYLWKTSLSTEGNLINGSIESHISYQGNVLVPSQKGEFFQLTMLSTSTGEVLWEWHDFYELDENSFITTLYQNGKYLAFQIGPRFYSIDLSNGNTIRKEERKYHARSITGTGDRYFMTGKYIPNDEGHYIGKLFTGTINQQDDTLLITPTYSLEHVDGNNRTGAIGSTTPFLDETGDTLITYQFADALPDWRANLYVGLYNYSKKHSVYNKILLAERVNTYVSNRYVYDGKAYYSSGKSIICIDVFTGERLWKRDFSEGFTFSGYIVADDKLIANCEDTYLYAMDPNTGKLLWKEKSSGTSSKMGYLNGVIYFTGGGDGLLHAVDVETGEHLWKIRSPDEEINSGAWFMRRITVLPPAKEDEKGKVIVSSYLSAFCYEAAR